MPCMAYGDAWDEREKSRDRGLQRIRNAMSLAMMFMSGAFAGATCMLLLGL